MRKGKGLRILHVVTDYIKVLDIPRALDELGYSVYKAELGTRAMGYHKEDSDKIKNAILELDVECVISYDFSENIAQACMEADVPYISWVYDAPQKELYTPYAMYPCNYIFVFDKMQQKRLKEIGVQNVFFMPLAIHPERIKRELQMRPAQKQNDIAFVGQLYCQTGMEYIVQNAPEGVKADIQKCIDDCFMKWNDNTSVHGIMATESAEYFDKLETRPIEEKYPYMTKEFYFEAAVLSRMLAFRERVHILNMLADKHNMTFYTFDKNAEVLNKNVNVRPGVLYDSGVSCVYRDSKINLNITLHCIESGACLRIFEVMAAGGFLISNYQKELEELFVPGKEIVLFHNEEELLQLVDYYLQHEDEREEIARNGQRKVMAYHSFHVKLDKIIETVYELEKKRKESYLSKQRKYLTLKTNDALESGLKEDIKSLGLLYKDPICQLAILEESDLGFVKEMLFVWEQEQSIKAGNVFNNVHTVEEAQRRYLRTRHILWRIENDCAFEACQEGVKELVDQDISSAFFAWLIKAKLTERKEVYLKLSEYIWNVKPMQALEIITYGLFDFPEDGDLLMYKANYLLELQCFKDALDTLRMIHEPNDEICEIIAELSEVLEHK